MVKTIDTLVEDIYSLFTKTDWTPDEDNVKEFGQKLAKHIAKRASDEQQKPRLRLSNLGTPNRKLWFTINKPEVAEPLPPEAHFKFLFGDILEETLLFLAKEAGHNVSGQQDQIDVNGVLGSRDAIIDGRVVDVKSASSYSFKKFEDNTISQPGNDPFGYLTQLDAYLEGSADATEKDVASFLVVDKTLGHITLNTQTKRNIDYETLIATKREMLQKSEPPEQKCYEPVPDGKSGNLKLDTGCSYCPFKWSCWPNLRGFAYSSKPVYLTRVVKTPKVPEFNSKGEYI